MQLVTETMQSRKSVYSFRRVQQSEHLTPVGDTTNNFKISLKTLSVYSQAFFALSFSLWRVWFRTLRQHFSSGIHLVVFLFLQVRMLLICWLYTFRALVQENDAATELQAIDQTILCETNFYFLSLNGEKRANFGWERLARMAVKRNARSLTIGMHAHTRILFNQWFRPEKHHEFWCKCWRSSIIASIEMPRWSILRVYVLIEWSAMSVHAVSDRKSF